MYTEVRAFIGWMKNHVTGSTATSTTEKINTEEFTSATTTEFTESFPTTESTTEFSTDFSTTTEPIICPEFSWKGGKFSKKWFKSYQKNISDTIKTSKNIKCDQIHI